MDLILPTLKRPTKALRAKIRFGIMLFGPEDQTSKRRICVIVAPDPESHVEFVRTMFEVTQKQYEQYVRSEPGASWPRKQKK